MGLQQPADIGIGEIGIGDDGARQAVAVGQATQPAGFVERIVRIAAVLDVDGLDDAQPRHVACIVGGKIVAADRRKVALQRFWSTGVQPRIGGVREAWKCWCASTIVQLPSDPSFIRAGASIGRRRPPG